MDFTLDEAQEELRSQARSFLASRSPLSQAAELAETDEGWDPGGWAEIANLGWLGASVPERLGGAGLGFVEEAILLEEFGRALYPGPYLATVGLALPALPDELLAEVATGGRRWSVELRPGWPVPNLSQVDMVVAERGERLVAIPADGAMGPTVDPSRRTGHLAPGPETRLLEGPAAARAQRQMRRRTRAGLALEAVGLGAAVLEMGVAHACTREQFGRPIGAYQAVAHKLADTYQELELARSAAYWAAWCIAEDDPEADVAAAAARALAAETAVAACERVIQVHGGMGFTWDAPLHRYYKRALWLERFAWSPAECRADVAAELLGEPTGG